MLVKGFWAADPMYIDRKAISPVTGAPAVIVLLTSYTTTEKVSTPPMTCLWSAELPLFKLAPPPCADGVQNEYPAQRFVPTGLRLLEWCCTGLLALNMMRHS